MISFYLSSFFCSSSTQSSSATARTRRSRKWRRSFTRTSPPHVRQQGGDIHEFFAWLCSILTILYPSLCLCAFERQHGSILRTRLERFPSSRHAWDFILLTAHVMTCGHMSTLMRVILFFPFLWSTHRGISINVWIVLSQVIEPFVSASPRSSSTSLWVSYQCFC